MGVYNQLITGHPFGDKPISNTGLLFTAALILVITILVLNMPLDSLIKKDGIYVKFRFTGHSKKILGNKFPFPA